MVLAITFTESIAEYVARWASTDSRSNRIEGYKYEAVGAFIKNLHLDKRDLSKMLHAALTPTNEVQYAKNLVEARHYFPVRTLLTDAAKDPRFVRGQLRRLLEGSGTVSERIDAFLENMEGKFKKSEYPMDYRF